MSKSSPNEKPDGDAPSSIIGNQTVPPPAATPDTSLLGRGKNLDPFDSLSSAQSPPPSASSSSSSSALPATTETADNTVSNGDKNHPAPFRRTPLPPLSPHAISELGKDWEKWLSDVQQEIELLRGLDPDSIFTQRAEDVRMKVAAHVIQLKQKMDDTYTTGVKNLHEEITELAERAGFHYAFFSYAYMSRLAFSLAFFCLAAYISAVTSMCTGYRTPLIKVYDLDLNPIEGVHTLPDIGHDIWAWVLMKFEYPYDYIDIYHIPDQIAAWMATFTSLFILSHPRRFLIIRRTTIIFAIVFLFRAFTVTVTSLPDASPTCVAQFGHPDGDYKREPMFPKVLIRAARFVLNPTAYVTCGDMIFSGHTTVLMMCAMIFRKYCRGKQLRSKVFFRSFHIPEGLCWCLRRLVYWTCGLGACLIIGTRLHYTLDVAIALYLTQRTFRHYHHMIKYPVLARKNTFYLWMLLSWLEAEDIIAIDSEAAKGVTKYDDAEVKGISKYDSDELAPSDS